MDMNEFKLDDEANLHCTVWRYSVIFHTLHLRITRQEQQIAALSFNDVAYFSGPLAWRGAQFRIGNSMETETVLRKLGRFEETQVHLQMILEHRRLYIVQANLNWLQTSEPLNIYILGSDSVNLIDRKLTLGDAEF